MPERCTRGRGPTSGDSVTLIAMADFLGGELRVTAPVSGADEVAIGDRLMVLASPDGAFFLAPAS